MKWCIFFIIIFPFISIGQIWSDPITGSQPGNSDCFTSASGVTINSNISVSGICRGPGLDGNNANDRYNADQWSTNSSLNNSDYFSFKLTPLSNDPNYQIYLSSFVYSGQASAQGPTQFAFRSSLDGFSSNIGSPSSTGATINLSNIIYQRLTTSIEFRLYGWGSGQNNGTFSVNDFSFNGFVKLPIQLASFHLSHQNGKPKITWSTYSELNNDYFTILRSKDGHRFEEITRVAGNGTSDRKNNYEYIDHTALPGKLFYKIKQADLDGSYSFTHVQSIVIESEQIIVHPTLVQTELTISVPSNLGNEGILSIYSIYGAKMYEIKKQNSLYYKISVAQLPAGHYVLEYKSPYDRKVVRWLKL